MTEETTFYSHESGIRVTNTRVIIRNTTYAMANIASVRAAVTKPSRNGPILFIVFGVLALLGGGAGESAGIAVLGLVIGVLGVLWWMVQKPTYHVRISSASGEVDALSSPGKEHIESVIQAINEAIIKRG